MYDNRQLLRNSHLKALLTFSQKGQKNTFYQKIIIRAKLDRKI